MANIKYAFYRDEDADKVADLFQRNKVFLAKYYEELSGEQVREFFKINGLITAVVGKNDRGEAVCFFSGCQRGDTVACTNRQMCMDLLVIDESLRGSVASIATMFLMILAKTKELGISELVSVVGASNLVSHGFQKRLGFILYDSVPNRYGSRVYHNFIPEIIRFMGKDFTADTGMIANKMQPARKRDPFKAADFAAEGVVINSWHTREDTTDYYIDIHRSNIVGICNECRFRIVTDLQNFQTVTFATEDDRYKDVRVVFYCGDRKLCEKNYDSESFTVVYEGETDKLVFYVPGEMYPLVFLKNIPVKANVEALNPNVRLDRLTGALEFVSHGKPVFCEMWPRIDFPSREGYITRYRKDLDITGTEKRLEVVCASETYRVVRTYTDNTDQTGEYYRISSQLEVFAETQLALAYQFYMDSAELRIWLHTVSGRRVLYNQKNSDKVWSDLLEVNLREDEAAREYADRVVLETEDCYYTITSDQRFTCLVNDNYVGIFPEPEDPAMQPEGMYRLPDLYIAVSGKKWPGEITD